MYEEDLNGAELECYFDLTTMAWWEHDETEDAERELRVLRDGTRRLLLHQFHMQNTAPPKRVRRIKRPPRRKREMSCWVSPYPPCTKSDPTWGAEGWRWGGEVGGGERAPASPQSGWCFVEASISGHSRKDWERSLNYTILVSLLLFQRQLRVSLCDQSVEPRGTMLPVQSESGIICDERQRHLTHRAA